MLNDEQTREIFRLIESRRWCNPNDAAAADDAITDYVESLIAAERERVIEMCAAVCDRRASDYHMSGHSNRADATEIAASEIRALKGK